MKELIRIFEKTERLAIGLMSGTSLDGVDIALVWLRGSGRGVSYELKDFHTYPIPYALRKRIQAAFTGQAEEICRLNFDLGSFFADLVLDFCSVKKVEIDEIDLIGSHGQTIRHIHSHSTLQIGEADMIARKTDTVVVSDFRAADIAAGGSGAPLVPYFDHVLFRDIPGNLALQNLGGIGNVTFLPSNRKEPVIAFDTGPANAVLNELSEIVSNGQHGYDKDGVLSKRGKCDPDILRELLTHPYFTAELPKTTGREEFGKEYVKRQMRNTPQLSPPDLLRTCLSLVAQSVVNAYRRYLPTLDRVIVSGGGAHHPLIVGEIREGLAGVEVDLIDSVCSIGSDSKEAVAFALLAHEKINQVPTNIPSVTGADRPVSLGKISVP